MEILFALDDGAFAPVKAHEWDAGFDLKTPDAVIIEEHGSKVIDTGVHVQIPEGYVGFLKSKSGLNVKCGLLSEGVIDAGYTGSIICKLYNNSDDVHVFASGEKVTQLVILPIPKVEMHQIELSDIHGGTRGSNGFGSSGR